MAKKFKLKKVHINIFLFLLLIFFLFKIDNVEGFTQTKKKELFDRFLSEDYKNIFPNGGRNSGGPMFYEYIVNSMDLDKEHFKLYNQFYCGVSGSIVSPNRSGGKISNRVVLEDLSGGKWFGKYYRCCVPCNCDIMRYTKVERHTVQLSDGDYPHFVITIKDPCLYKDKIPSEVTAFKCQNGLTNNGIRTNSGRLIIGVLYGINEMEEQPVKYDPSIHNVDADNFCKERICQNPDELKGGMGDIFVLLSLVGENDNSIPPVPDRFNCPLIERMENSEGTHNSILNIYGEPLKKCRADNEDLNGSWDSNGFCSELDGGVHQICFDVNNNTKEFSSHTGQSDWSLERNGKNHCMCLGAWSLYKAKQKKGLIQKTFNELKCESIPQNSLTDQYVNKWNTWNGNELPNQIVHGVNELVKYCYNKGNYSQKRYLKNKYLSLVNDKIDFHSTETYNSINR
tara:strand:+ start:783 stop:2144 length:1362 start_codon:yes stop_codon:yes gene_type:complete